MESEPVIDDRSGDTTASESSAEVNRPAPNESFRCIAIVGVGLIGGSLGMALRARGLAGSVLGIDRSEAILARARNLGAIDTGTVDLLALLEADCVFFASSVGGLPALMTLAAPFISPGAIVTDVGSLKRRIVEVGENLFGARFIGGHPMAGSESSGIDAARAGLFEGASWALASSRQVPPQNDEAHSRISALVRALGAKPIPLSPERHDHLVALVSHLPHALSFAFSQALALQPAGAHAIAIAGPSYRDISRISHASPDLWADILMENRDELLPAIASFEASLSRIRAAAETGDRDALLTCLTRVDPTP